MVFPKHYILAWQASLQAQGAPLSLGNGQCVQAQCHGAKIYYFLKLVPRQGECHLIQVLYFTLDRGTYCAQDGEHFRRCWEEHGISRAFQQVKGPFPSVVLSGGH